MSGDSLDYLEYRLQELGEKILRRSRCPEHTAFAKHLLKCYEAALMLAKVWGDDCSPGDEMDLIREAIGPNPILVQTIADARAAADKLRDELEKVND
jgi:hypothetical protein